MYTLDLNDLRYINENNYEKLKECGSIGDIWEKCLIESMRFIKVWIK